MLIWLIGLVIVVVVVGTIAGGAYLWWPGHSTDIGRQDLGVALLTGALIAFSVLVIQLLVDFRARQADQRRQAASEHQSLQISLGPRKLPSIDLSDANLEKFYMRHKVLTDANLSHSRLKNAVLAQARLVRADLTGADLTSAVLTGAFLTNATLDDAHLEKADMYGAHLNGASLEGAHLDGATLTDAHLQADLKLAQLDEATLDNADLAKADLIGADLRDAWLADADLRGAILYGANLQGTRTTLPYALLDGAKYDRKTTKWPVHLAPPVEGNVAASNGWPPWMRHISAKCHRDRCTIHETPPAPTELKTFRESLAKHPPLRWTVVTRDPAGISLVARSGGAHFNGETLDWYGDARGCANEIRQDDYGRGTFWHHRWRVVEVRGLPALARSYAYRDRYGPHRATDVFYVKRPNCYRFQAVALPGVFALFKGDFNRMFSELHVTPLPLRGT
jgi:uncharacterized protein YjbI with pentapeptide repeats